MNLSLDEIKNQVQQRLRPDSFFGCFVISLLIIKWKFFVTIAAEISEKFPLEEKIDLAGKYFCNPADLLFALVAACLYTWVVPEVNHWVSVRRLKRKINNEKDYSAELQSGVVPVQHLYQVIATLRLLQTYAGSDESGKRIVDLISRIQDVQKFLEAGGKKDRKSDLDRALNVLSCLADLDSALSKVRIGKRDFREEIRPFIHLVRENKEGKIWAPA